LSHLASRFRNPRGLLILGVILIAVAIVSRCGWIAIRNHWRDAVLHRIQARISANRGITIVKQPILTLKGHVRPVYRVAFSPDGTRMASAGGDGDATIKIWNSQTAELLLTLEGHDRGVYNLTFSPDGKRLASAGHDHTAVIWDLVTGKAVRTITGLEIHVFGIAFSPDAQRLITADADSVRVWEVETGREILTLQGCAPLALSPDGKRLVSGGPDWNVKVWDAATGNELLQFFGHNRVVRDVAFSPDGERIASASDDHSVKVWHAATGKEIATFTGHGAWRSARMANAWPRPARTRSSESGMPTLLEKSSSFTVARAEWRLVLMGND
jgi:WD40 repeat protein